MTFRVVAVAATATLVGGIFGAFTASVNVPASAVAQATHALTINEIAPSQCAGITLTNIVIGSGTVNGTAANDLIIGSSGSDTLKGNGGADCMVGGSHGGTRDTFQGGPANDVCIGDGTRTDSYTSCKTIVNR
jgi:Ca2+-binding RTX toxin-like protein